MSLYFKYFKVHLKSELEYKSSFILSFLSQLFTLFSYYFTIICLFDQFSNIKGFKMYDVLLTFGIIQFGFAFCETFFRGIDQFDNLIIDGNFDRLLLRPRNVLFQLFCDKLSLIRIAKVIEALVVLIIAIINIEVNWNIYRILTLISMLFSGIIVFLAIFIATASYCFLTLKGLEVRNVLTDGCKHMAQYPIGIFKKGFITFFTFIVPMGLVNYYPLLFLLGKSNNKFYGFCPLLTILYLIPSIWLFYRGLKRYSSSGS